MNCRIKQGLRGRWFIFHPRKAAEADFTELDLLAEKQAKAFEDGVPGARVIRERGMHYIFSSNESDVLHEMRFFLSNLR
jgi:hypothetical protein